MLFQPSRGGQGWQFISSIPKYKLQARDRCDDTNNSVERMSREIIEPHGHSGSKCAEKTLAANGDGDGGESLRAKKRRGVW
jgi:hypothetical protein